MAGQMNERDNPRQERNEWQKSTMIDKAGWARQQRRHGKKEEQDTNDGNESIQGNTAMHIQEQNQNELNRIKINWTESNQIEQNQNKLNRI